MYQKRYDELDELVLAELYTKQAIDFLTETGRGCKRYRKEFIGSYECSGDKSSGGYADHPYIRISGTVMNNYAAGIYKDEHRYRNRKDVGNFYGEAKSILFAMICHNLVHSIQYSPYFRRAAWEFAQREKLHGTYWLKLYSMLRNEFINPHVDKVPDVKECVVFEQYVKPMYRNGYDNRNGLRALCKKQAEKEANKFICNACGDEYIPARCPHGLKHMNDDGLCMDCHIEMNHYHMPDPACNRSTCGNAVGYPSEDKIYFPGICDRFYRV